MPLEKGPEGKAELHYTGVFKLFARWAEDGSLERAFLASVTQLDETKKLDLSLLHGDGSNTIRDREELGKALQELGMFPQKRDRQ